MKAEFYRGIIPEVVDLKAAEGSFSRHSSQLLKIVVEHSGMTNQTHLLFGFFGVGSDNCAAPRQTTFWFGRALFKPSLTRLFLLLNIIIFPIVPYVRFSTHTQMYSQISFRGFERHPQHADKMLKLNCTAVLQTIGIRRLGIPRPRLNAASATSRRTAV